VTARVALSAAIVVIPADRAGRFGAHEAYVEPASLDASATDDDEGAAPRLAPTLAQLWAAIAGGLIDRPRTAERVAELVIPDDARAVCRATGVGAYEILVTPTGPLTASPLQFPAVARAVTEPGPARWARLVRAAVPRDGRGAVWPAARVIRRGNATREAAALAPGERVVRRFDDGAWSWIATAEHTRPLGWVPSSALIDAEVADAG